VAKLNYPHIATDLEPVATQLVDVGLAEDGADTLPVRDLLKLLPIDELHGERAIHITCVQHWEAIFVLL
jgi:hypothetical protein